MKQNPWGPWGFNTPNGAQLSRQNPLIESFYAGAVFVNTPVFCSKQRGKWSVWVIVCGRDS